MTCSTDVRALLSEEEHAAVTATVLDSNPNMAVDTGQRVVDEAIKFVVACATRPGVGLAPPRVVDEGWHALLLHSALYARLCARFGDFVHHYPGWDPTNYDPQILDRTRQAITECGWEPDNELWGHPTEGVLVEVAAKCQHSPDCAIRPMPKPEWP
ncbi:hypothetical protein GL263_22600 [Streptomyces durbertensis]|uniref:Uncharacterized protein n=1 Tax=Streptomyces durbertensis TaxID=2448886 RepID=A0ABR6ELV0_9ACTN|nr:hypothetical protein [Streptomyces durbertensis]MBB1246324.1 hypothetical protein [Streptomyces durbertensis]